MGARSVASSRMNYTEDSNKFIRCLNEELKSFVLGIDSMARRFTQTRQDHMFNADNRWDDLQFTPNHLLECPTVATKLLKMGMVPLRDSLREILCSPDAPKIAEAVIKTFDGI
ncbi:hypothetical protein TNCV_4635401 [Trichonephila clavipes]|nr:hypothetical protein TNCV_4635401 [Trichonephila clavipes]